MITLNVNLGNLKSVVRNLNGTNGDVECLIIPIEENKLFKGKKGVYLEIVAFEYKESNNDRKDTHLLKQSFSKEEQQAMTETEKNNIPLLGNLTDWNKTEVNESKQLKFAEAPKDNLPY